MSFHSILLYMKRLSLTDSVLRIHCTVTAAVNCLVALVKHLPVLHQRADYMFLVLWAQWAHFESL